MWGEVRIKIFFQEWNNQLDKQLLIENLKLETSQIKQNNLNKQLVIEELKLARSNIEQDIINKQLEIEELKLTSSNQNKLVQANLNNDDVIFVANNLEKEMNFKYKTTIKITFIKNKI